MIGQDLLDVPFADLVHALALAIADGQLKLDQSSIKTLDFLVHNNVDIITEITDVISTSPGVATLPDNSTVPFTGAKVTSTPGPAVPMSLFQAGLTPTFYRFTDASIEVKISITIKQGSQAQLSIHASTVDFRASNTYSYTAQGSSVLRATIRPVPPPSRLNPQIVTVDATVQPARVTITGG